jgi:hypothetical protein
VHEPGIEAERDVVQEEPSVHACHVDPPLTSGEGGEGGDGVVAIETEVAGEVVPRAERDDDERDVVLDGHLGHGCERAVAARDADRPVRGACQLDRVVPRLEHPRLDPEPLSLAAELARVRSSAAGARVDDEEAADAVSIANQRGKEPRGGADREA